MPFRCPGRDTRSPGEASPKPLCEFCTSLTQWLPQTLSDRACSSRKGHCQAQRAARLQAAGFSHFKQHMQIKLARVPLHLLSSSATLPNNSQAKLTQFEIKIRFIFRGIYFSLASVSVDALSVWPDKHPSTLSPDPLSPSDSHLIDKRHGRV